MFESLNFDWLDLFWHRRGKKVLIVEDDIGLKQMMARIIYSIDEAASIKWVTQLKEAKQALDQERFDLVISDCLLQGETGFELWKICRVSTPGVPFLLMSALDSRVIRQLADEDPPPFLGKPFGISDCRDVLADLLEWKAL